MEDKRHAAPYPRLLGVLLFAIAMAPGLEAGEASGGTPALRSNKRAAESSSLKAGSPHKRPNVASLPPVANGGASQSVGGGAGNASAPDQGAFYDQVGGSSFDDRMHGRNRYFGRRPDFATLAAKFADFAALTITVAPPPYAVCGVLYGASGMAGHGRAAAGRVRGEAAAHDWVRSGHIHLVSRGQCIHRVVHLYYYLPYIPYTVLHTVPLLLTDVCWVCADTGFQG